MFKLQAKSLLNLFETDALQLNKYMRGLHDVCKNIVDCEVRMLYQPPNY